MLNKMGVMTVHHSWMRFTTASKGPRDCLLAALAQAVAAASLPWFWLHPLMPMLAVFTMSNFMSSKHGVMAYFGKGKQRPNHLTVTVSKKGKKFPINTCANGDEYTMNVW
jgi:hypothetical protein